jgi:DNA-binding transcriptional LysR family regulator
MQISLRALRYLVAAADCGNVTEAARRLNVSQPSISGAIAQLEAELAIPLFVRHHARGVTPTVAGQRLVNEARLLLNHAQDFTQSAQSLGDALRGEITIGCFLTVATRYMPALLSAFAQSHPGISVRLEEGDQDEIVAGLLSGRTEYALSYGYALPEDIEGERLADLPPHAMVGERHRLAGRGRISLKELAGDDFLLLDLPHSRDYFLGLLAACGMEPRIVFRSRSSELIRGLVGHGFGFTLHNAVARNSVAYDGSRLAVLPLDEDLPAVRVTSLRLRRQTTRPAVEAFAGFVRAAFAPGGLFAA